MKAIPKGEFRPEVERLLRALAKADPSRGVANIAAVHFDGPVLSDMLQAAAACGDVYADVSLARMRAAGFKM